MSPADTFAGPCWSIANLICKMENCLSSWTSHDTSSSTSDINIKMQSGLANRAVGETRIFQILIFLSPLILCTICFCM